MSDSNPMRSKVPALRIVHLVGGLRAIDLNQDEVLVGVSETYVFARLKTPPYSDLYRQLETIGFRVIGVDFLTNHDRVELSPPDFEAFCMGSGFYAMEGERAWSRVRHAAANAKNWRVKELSGKIRTYLRLLPMRLREISEAYNSCLRQAVLMRNSVKIGHNFSNQWTVHIDAAVHAYLSDAGAFRDVLSEFTWRVILGEGDGVTRHSKLIRKTNAETSDLLRYIHESSREGGWLFQLGALRDEVIHAAPIADSQEFHFGQLRALAGAEKGYIATLHLALLQADGSVRKPERPDGGADLPIKTSLKAYRQYVETGRDALAVCEGYLVDLVKLSDRLRLESGLKEEEVVLTGKDIIGPVEVFPPTTAPS